MFNFFLTKNHPFEYAIKKYSRFDFIKRQYLHEINKLLDYYHNRDRSVPGGNLFYKLIHGLDINIYDNIGDYFKYIDRNSEYVAKTMKLTMNSAQGEVFENLFYRDNSYAVINYVTSEYDLYNIEKNWIHYTPLTVTYSNITDLDFYLFDKTKRTNRTIVMVTELDVNLMLLMYYCWCKQRLAQDRSTNPGAFVYKILYPNMMVSHIDIAIFNRLMWKFYKYDLPNFELDHPFHVIDFTRYIDDILNNIIKDVDKGSYYAEQLIKMIPTVTHKDMLEALYINRKYPTRQSEWAIWIARLKYINFLIDILGERGVARNRDLFYTLPSKIKALENRSTYFESILPNVMLTDYKYEIENIKSKIGRR